jgi:lipoprotein-releasing system permease protein
LSSFKILFLLLKVIILKTEFFIARRIIRGTPHKNRLSKPIILISIASIAIGVAVMLIAVSMITGFQEGIRDKVTGFGSHIQITKDGLSNSMESNPILIQQDFYPSLADKEAVKNIQVFAYKPAILQAQRDSVVFEQNGTQNVQSTQDILGVLFKGIGTDYDYSFFDDKIIEGRVLSDSLPHTEILISQYIANMLGYKVGDNCDAFFIRDNKGPKKKVFKIVGIYRSGFEDFDKKLIFTSIHHIQEMNNWGVQTYLTLADTCIDGKFVMKGLTNGGSGEYIYDWGDGFKSSPYHPLNLEAEKKLRLISSDTRESILSASNEMVSVPDTAYFNILVDSTCDCTPELLASQPFKYNNSTDISTPFGQVLIVNGKGTQHLYTGGFEVNLNRWEDLKKLNTTIYEEIPYDLKTSEITEMHKDIFAWLDLLDLNIIIIIVLVLIVSLINMITSLLVLILEKTNMIGILKAVGTPSYSIQYIFIFHALFLLGRGLIIGNIIGLTLMLVQHYTGFISLNASVYSLDAVSVNFSLLHFVLINGLTIVMCVIILILPSYLVTKIQPAKAIQFD